MQFDRREDHGPRKRGVSSWASGLKHTFARWLNGQQQPNHDELLVEYERVVEQALAAARKERKRSMS